MAEPKSKKNPLYVRDCQLCGCPLGFGKTHEGKTVPLDLRSPVYSVITDEGLVRVVRTELAYVTHFSTCTNPEAFSKTKKGAGV